MALHGRPFRFRISGFRISISDFRFRADFDSDFFRDRGRISDFGIFFSIKFGIIDPNNSNTTATEISLPFLVIWMI